MRKVEVRALQRFVALVPRHTVKFINGQPATFLRATAIRAIRLHYYPQPFLADRSTHRIKLLN